MNPKLIHKQPVPATPLQLILIKKHGGLEDFGVYDITHTASLHEILCFNLIQLQMHLLVDVYRCLLACNV